MQESGELRGVLWTLSATYVAWRITFGFWKKLGRRVQHNVNCKADLEYMHEKVAGRIEVMHQLVEKDGAARSAKHKSADHVRSLHM